MKKLMIAAAIVCAAAFAQAGAVQWKSGELYAATSANGGWGTGDAQSLYELGYTAYMAVTYVEKDVYDGLAGKTQADIWKTYGNAEDITKIGYSKDEDGNWQLNAKTYVKDSNGGSTTAKDNAGVANTDYYAIVLETYHDDNLDKDFYIATTATTRTNGSGVGSAASLISNVGTREKDGGWQAVPEPTSGLLLLLGVAGLALRRRRA